MCKKQLQFIIMTVLFVCSVDNSFCADMTVFGIELGKPLTLKQCESGVIGSGDKMCVSKTWQELIGYDQKVRIIRFGREEYPLYTKGILVPLEIDGSVEGIEIQSGGIRDQNSLYIDLCSKYGQPTKVIKKQVKNKLGGIFESIDADWSKGPVFIQMSGVFISLDKGRTTIDTEKGKALREKWIKDFLGKQKKM